MNKVVLKNFFRPFNGGGTALYDQDVGWNIYDYNDAMSTEPKEILRYYLERGDDLYFFDTVTLRWYVIDNRYPNRIALSILHLNEEWDGMYFEENYTEVDWLNCKDIPDVIFECETPDEFLNGAKIGEDAISDIMARSYIVFS